MADSRFMNYKNKSICYNVYGKGRPVVLLHGLPANSSLWNDMAASLQDDFLVIAPDIPGSGRSEMLEGENIGLEDYAAAIKAILDNELQNLPAKVFQSHRSSPFPPPSGEIEGAGFLIDHPGLIPLQ